MCSTSAQYALSHYGHHAFAPAPYHPAYAAAAHPYHPASPYHPAAHLYPGYGPYHGW